MLSNDKNYTGEDVINIISDMKNMKTSLVEYVMKQHTTFEKNNILIQDLADQFKTAHERSQLLIDNTEKTCADLFLSLEDTQRYKNQISSLLLLRNTTIDLIELDKHVRKLNSLEMNEFELSVTSLNTLSREIICLENIVERASSTLRSQDNRVYQALIRNLSETKFQLIERVNNVWNEKVVIDRNGRNPYYDYKNPSKNECIIPISKKLSFNLNTDILRELICLMHTLQIGHKNMLLLMTFISEELIYPVIQNFQKFSISSSSDNNKISIFLNSKLPDESTTLLERANAFLDSLTNTFGIIYKELLTVAHDDKRMQTNTLIKEVQNTMFGEKLIDSITNQLTPELYTIRQEITERLYEFQKLLIEYEIINCNNVSLREFIDNIDRSSNEFIINHYFTQCRTLYHDSILKYKVKSRELFQTLDPVRPYETNDDMPELHKFIDFKSVTFPNCNVSTIAYDVVYLLLDIMSNFRDGYFDDKADIINFISVLPNCMSMYLSVVPIVSQKELQEIPKAAALHYNNCMFIAHFCLILPPSFSSLCKKIIKRLKVTDPKHLITCNNAPVSLLRVAYQLRKVAADTLSNEGTKQKEQLNDFFAGINSFAGIGAREQRVIVEKGLKKCYMHLCLLSEAYYVLPETIYNSFFAGMLIDHGLNIVIERVLNMTDIVQNDTVEIVTLATEYCDRLLSIIKKYDLYFNYKDESTITIAYMIDHVPCWQKMNMLLFVLRKSLVEIEDHYADGKGPLAAHFSVPELKSLIKALFKNSHLRASVLEKIK